MADIQLTLEPLSREAFAPFGDVIEISDDNTVIPINYGLTERHHDLANVDVGDDGKVIISLFRTQAATLPFRVEVMERHPQGSQAFIALSGIPTWWWWHRRVSSTPTHCARSSPRRTRASTTTGGHGITTAWA